jgi:hypothetical protein
LLKSSVSRARSPYTYGFDPTRWREGGGVDKMDLGGRRYFTYCSFNKAHFSTYTHVYTPYSYHLTSPTKALTYTPYKPSLENSMATKPGLYANINAKKERMAAGSKEKMRKPGDKGAPSKMDFIKSAKTAKKK